MTQRAIQAGLSPTVIIKAGMSVTVKGQDGDLVLAQGNSLWGLVIGRNKDVIEVRLGGSGDIRVPFASNVKVYAGKDIDVQGVHGQVDCFAGFRLNIRDVYRLGHASAGWTMNVDCETILGAKAEFKAGGDLRFHIHDLTSARIRVKDIGGYWEARIGNGERGVYLKSGGDATLVTDQKVEALPPNYILGNIEKPPA